MKVSVIIEQIRRRLGIESLNDMQTTMDAKANASNVVLLSPTGSGKTIAYLLPLLKNIKASTGRVQAVVIAPSRELAVQISKVAQAIAVGLKVTCCYGGHNVTDEENSLSVVPDILVGTPGRLLDHAKRGNVYLQPVRILVLDEFDKSLELGFHEEMHKLICSASVLSVCAFLRGSGISGSDDHMDHCLYLRSRCGNEHGGRSGGIRDQEKP